MTYSLIGEHGKNFNIDSISGVITVQNSSFLDRERLAEASFSIMATDKAPITTRRSSIVPVNINANNPNLCVHSEKANKKKKKCPFSGQESGD